MRARDVPGAAVYLLGNAVTGLLTLLVSVLLFAAGGVLAVVVVGLPLLAGLGLIGLPVAAIERRLQRLIDGRPLPHRHRVPPEPGLASWLRTRYTEAGTWRELGFAGLLMTVLWPVDLLAVILGVTVPPALVATPVLFGTIGDAEQVNVLKAYPVTSWTEAFLSAAAGLVAVAACAGGLVLLARVRAALARAILTPRHDLDETVVELTRSRVRLVDAFEAERTRIERDLHDGAQQRLVALTVMLGLARLDAGGPLADQLSRAHDQAGLALVELRELIRGIHPPVLTDFGLEAAVADLADRCPVPVDVAFDVPQRFSAAVESAAYFVVSEALANLARHSGADRGTITGRYAARTLTVEIGDNGRGGADIGAGTGLLGLADRVSVVGGRLSLSSPPGGPTRLIVEIPCQACG
ncbi:sensor histidine kinase [Actinoplanes xinjiangensis]|uniref:histidine kinase n=1 Tax=Actinoplanes xinjiangensis TaxID=512350 RepID=A0A316F4Y5_9ACTN|nr:sensor domain-containing protein [Actinoplanes xinjiangensis]PWK39568.1 signal transduction histidine kinase [Actinoplanes xinjiangensis]GIF42569.1 histidine kinase [Actinoplanes xinjiangensis]